jgi:hypothetical protein
VFATAACPRALLSALSARLISATPDVPLPSDAASCARDLRRIWRATTRLETQARTLNLLEAVPGEMAALLVLSDMERRGVPYTVELVLEHRRQARRAVEYAGEEAALLLPQLPLDALLAPLRERVEQAATNKRAALVTDVALIRALLSSLIARDPLAEGRKFSGAYLSQLRARTDLSDIERSLIHHIVEARACQGFLRATARFGANMRKGANGDAGRVYPRHRQCSTSTGRITMVQPALTLLPADFSYAPPASLSVWDELCRLASGALCARCRAATLEALGLVPRAADAALKDVLVVNANPKTPTSRGRLAAVLGATVGDAFGGGGGPQTLAQFWAQHGVFYTAEQQREVRQVAVEMRGPPGSRPTLHYPADKVFRDDAFLLSCCAGAASPLASRVSVSPRWVLLLSVASGRG